MKTVSISKGNSDGYVSVAMVAVLALLITFSLAITFSHSIDSQDFQSRVQVRSDFSQKEDAVIRSLVSILPNRAIGAMQDGSNAQSANFSWATIFAEAIDLADAEQAVDSVVMADFGITDFVSGNSGDHAIADSSSMITPVLGSAGAVTSGTVADQAIMFDSRFSTKMPDPLEAPASVMSADRNFPIISTQKVFSSSWTNDAQLSITDYPLYNRIAYPNIRFGFKQPGEAFIAKRNWWAFSIRFGQSAASLDQPLLTRNYVVSIYELPSQQPIEAETFMSVGSHANGEAWTNSAVDGGISAGILKTDASFDLLNGNLTGRTGLDLGNGTTVRGQVVSNNFDALGVREAAFANSANDVGRASLAGNSGRVAFVPINRGLDFYTASASAEANMVSPTGWNEYSRGADQCEMKIIIDEVESVDNQRPTRVRWEYRTAGGGVLTTVLERGVNWPYLNEAGGSLVPFQTEHLENGRDALVVHLEQMRTYLTAMGGAGATVNNSLLINVDNSLDPDVKMPEFPTVSHDVCLVLRDCADLSAYTEGFSLVTNLRLYVADDFNTVQIPQPANSGLGSGEPFYPATSLFAPEKRYGTTLKMRPVEYRGQVASLAEGDLSALHPLDFRIGTYDTVSAAMITTDLHELTSPAELPPIHLMNWLITVEEIR